jgi:hypothetical protein
MPVRPDCQQSDTSPHRCSTCGCYPVLVYIAGGGHGFLLSAVLSSMPREPRPRVAHVKPVKGK